MGWEGEEIRKQKTQDSLFFLFFLRVNVLESFASRRKKKDDRIENLPHIPPTHHRLLSKELENDRVWVLCRMRESVREWSVKRYKKNQKGDFQKKKKKQNFSFLHSFHSFHPFTLKWRRLSMAQQPAAAARPPPPPPPFFFVSSSSAQAQLHSANCNSLPPPPLSGQPSLSCPPLTRGWRRAQLYCDQPPQSSLLEKSTITQLCLKEVEETTREWNSAAPTTAPLDATLHTSETHAGRSRFRGFLMSQLLSSWHEWYGGVGPRINRKWFHGCEQQRCWGVPLYSHVFILAHPRKNNTATLLPPQPAAEEDLKELFCNSVHWPRLPPLKATGVRQAALLSVPFWFLIVNFGKFRVGHLIKFVSLTRFTLFRGAFFFFGKPGQNQTNYTDDNVTLEERPSRKTVTFSCEEMCQLSQKRSDSSSSLPQYYKRHPNQ